MSNDDRLDDDETEMNDRLEDLTVGGVKPNRVPIGASEEVDTEVAEGSEEVATPKEDAIEEPVAEIPSGVDPLDRKFTYQDMMKEAKRLKDEYAGKLGWVSKNVKQKYGGKQQEFESTLAKGEKFDELTTKIKELEAAVKQAQKPRQDAPSSGEKAKPKPDMKAIAAKIGKDKNLSDASVEVLESFGESLVESLLSGKVDINEGQAPTESDEELAKRMVAIEWKRAIDWAESQPDYQSNAQLQIRAEYRARKLNERPDIALQNARKELGLVKTAKKVVTGPARQGTPAVAKDNNSGDSDVIEYDGKSDPLDTIKAKWAKKGK